MIAVPGCDREAISCSLSKFVRNLELGRMLHEYHLSKSSLSVMEDKLNHVRQHLNPDLWAETFADDEDFYEAGYQPGDEVELFAADEAGQLCQRRLDVLEKYDLAEAIVPPVDYSLAGPHKDLLPLTYSLTPASSPEMCSPAPPEDSPTWDDLGRSAAQIRLQSSAQPVIGECWPVRLGVVQGDAIAPPSGAKPPNDDHLTRLEHLNPGANGEIANPVARGLDFAKPRLVKKDEPSLVRSGTKPPNDNHFWPIFAGADGSIVNPVARGLNFKRDAPDRMPDAPISGDGDDDGADGESRLCCFALIGWTQVSTTECITAPTSDGSSGG